jgi:hypothetical protein
MLICFSKFQKNLIILLKNLENPQKSLLFQCSQIQQHFPATKEKTKNSTSFPKNPKNLPKI